MVEWSRYLNFKEQSYSKNLITIVSMLLQCFISNNFSNYTTSGVSLFEKKMCYKKKTVPTFTVKPLNL